MAIRAREQSSEQGAILIQTALTILVLIGFATFVVDYGILWVSRGQAQNAADAGALAGAIGMAFDEPGIDPEPGGKVEAAARLAARGNRIWNVAPEVVVQFPCRNALRACVRTDVYRNGEFGSASLPVVFAPLLGITEQGVRATATAQVEVGNTTRCLRPLGVALGWRENPATDPDEYNGGAEAPPNDVFRLPTDADPGTGYELPGDYGRAITLRFGTDPMAGTASIVPGWSLPLRLPDAAGGWLADEDFVPAISSCAGNTVKIGDWLPTQDDAMVDEIEEGYVSLRARDPLAAWDGTAVTDSCAPDCAPFSPRVVPIAVFDTDDFQRRMASGDWSVCPTGGRCVRVVNIVGLFVASKAGNDITGHLMRYPGEVDPDAPTLFITASFLATAQLIR